MKKLIALAIFSLATAYSIPSAFAGGVIGTLTTHLVHDGAHPNEARALSVTHHFEVHVQGSELSQLIINLPEGIKVRRGIEVTDRSGQKIDTTVSINDGRATLTFAQPVSSETTLLVDIKGVQTPAPGYARTWLYSVYGRSVGMTTDKRIGLAQIKTYE